MAPRSRKINILVTGTPGTGKTTLSELIAGQTGLNHINVGKIVAEKALHQGWDNEFESYLIDEDKVVDELEDIMSEGGNIVDYHGCDFFPERYESTAACVVPYVRRNPINNLHESMILL